MKVGLVLAVSLVAAGQSAQAATQASAAPLKADTSDLASLQQQLHDWQSGLCQPGSLLCRH